MKIVILDALTFGDTPLDGFDVFGDVEIYETTSSKQTKSRITNSDVIVTNKVIITDELMSCAKNLKLICVAATGMNNIDIEAANKRGIEVKNVAGYSTNSVVQHTFSMLFYLAGHSRYYDDIVKSRNYSRGKIFTDVSHPFFEIRGKKWGIIGLGEIGRGVAEVAKSFGADIWYYSTSKKNQNPNYKRVELDELLKGCDIISVHAPLNENTKNLLGYEQLLMCKEKAVILNLGRGGIISEEGVSRVVDEREIYIGLDVFTTEPLEINNPLLNVKNSQRLYLTPHIAWTSIEARDKLIKGVIQNIKASFG